MIKMKLTVYSGPDVHLGKREKKKKMMSKTTLICNIKPQNLTNIAEL